MSGSREVANAMRPGQPDAVETPGELSGVKILFHNNHTSDLKISGPENLPDCIQQEAANSSQSSSGKRRLRLTSEQLKETKRKSKLPPVRLFEGHYIYSHSVRVRNIPKKQSDLDKKNLLEGLSDQGLIARHQMSEQEEMPEAKRLKVSIVNDADIDPEIEVIMDGGGTSSPQFIVLDTSEDDHVTDTDHDITPTHHSASSINVSSPTDSMPTPTALIPNSLPPTNLQTAGVLLQQPEQQEEPQHLIIAPHDLINVGDNMVLTQVMVESSSNFFKFIYFSLRPWSHSTTFNPSMTSSTA